MIVRLPGISKETTAQGRGAERYRKAAITTFGTVVVRGAQALLSFVTIPIALHHYGPERYGLWLTISSLLTILVFVDQGMGFGLVQLIAKARGEEDRTAIAEYHTTGLVSMAALGGLVVAAALTSTGLVKWDRVFNVQSKIAADEAGAAVIVLAVGFASSAVAGVCTRVHQGFQEGALATAWQLLGSVLAVAGVFFAVNNDRSLAWLVGAMVGGPALGAAIGSIYQLARLRPWLRPQVAHFSTRCLGTLLRVSGVFLVTQLSTALVLGIDNFLVARAVGAAGVPDYAVPARLFYYAQTLVVLVPQALWPAYTEAMSHGDDAWAKRAFGHATSATLVAAGSAAIGLTLVGPALLRLWVGSSVSVDRSLLMSLAVALVAQCVGAHIVTILSGVGAFRGLVLMSVAVAIISIPLKLLALTVLGRDAIPIATAVAFAVGLVAPGMQVIRMRFAVDHPRA